MGALKYLAVVVMVVAVSLMMETDLFLTFAPAPPRAAFEDQVIWVTGASSGLGAELSVQLTELGARVIMSARTDSKLQDVAKKCIGKHKPHLITLDVTDYDATLQAHKKVSELFGGLDMVVLNAGRSQRMSAMDMPFNETVALMETNFFSAVYLAKLVLPDMIKRKSGKIVGVSSLSGKIGTPGGSSYSATKYAMHGYFDALRSELGDSGVKVSLVLPGPVESNVVQSAVRSQNSVPNEGKKMATSHFVRIMIKGLYHDVNEMWISSQPFLLLTYISQYMPWVSRQMGMLVGPTRIKLLKEAKDPFDVKKLLGI